MKSKADKLYHAYLEAAAREVYRQVAENPGLGIPVDPDVADHMGAFQETAIDPLHVFSSHADAASAVGVAS